MGTLVVGLLVSEADWPAVGLAIVEAAEPVVDKEV